MPATAVVRTHPLSPLQEALLSRSLYARGSGVAIWQVVLELRERLDAPRFRAALQRLVERHPPLRTAFRWEDVEEPVQDVYEEVEVPVEEQDWGSLPGDEQRIRLESYLREDRRRGFAPDRPPLLRLAMFHTGADSATVVVTIHHAVIDGRSAGIGLMELFGAYEGGAAEAAAGETSFEDYVRHVRSLDPQAAERYWSARLAGFAEPTPLPLEQPPRGEADGEGEGHAEVERRLERAATDALRALAGRLGVSLNVLVQAAWAVLLGRYAGEDDVVFAAIKSCRAGIPGGDSLVGPLINTVPVRARLDGDRPLADLLADLQRDWRALRPFEHTPLARVQEWSEVPAGQPLARSLLIFENYRWNTAIRALGGAWAGRTVWLRRQPDLPLTLYAFGEPRLVLSAIYDRRRFDGADMERLLGHLAHLLEQMTAHPEARLGDLGVLPPAERRRVLVEWNDSGKAAGEGLSLDALVSRQAGRTPQATAVVWEQERLTYGELEAQANRLARRLRRLGVTREQRVGVLLERGLELPGVLLAVLKAGAAYVPLDPKYPAERLEQMFVDSGIAVLVTRSTLAGRVPAVACPVVELDSEGPALAALPADPVASAAAPDQLAYVIYTSGSTGRPKGVAITHGNAAALVGWAARVLEPADLEGVVASTSICFDLSVFEIFATLAHGGRVLLAPSILRLPLAPWRDEARLINTVPSAMAELLRLGALPPRLRTVNLAGEALTPDLVDALYRLPSVERVLDLYGPSEDTTYSTWEARRPGGDQSIGRPVAGTRVYLLDRRLEPVPPGATGELMLAGAGLARGYLGRPAATAASFLPDPWGQPGERLYRTGDLARHLPDGRLALLGRRDRQSKLRGYRIEPGEVEAALRRDPRVAEAAVVVREDAPGDHRLVAYVVGRSGEPPAAELLEHLRGRLPHFMVPSAVVALPLLPRTPSGKLDARGLPAPEQHGAPTADYVPPASELERVIAEIWQEVLGVERVGLHDNFFDLGGHSLAVARVYQRLAERSGRTLSEVELFEHPTVGSLARRLSRDGEEEMPLDAIQQRAEAQRAARRARRRATPEEAG